MTLSGVMAVKLRYFNEFCIRAFQLITTSSSIELIWSRVNFYNTYRAVKLVCITKFTHVRVDTAGESVDVTYV